jgi:hypothetical protein
MRLADRAAANEVVNLLNVMFRFNSRFGQRTEPKRF